MSPTTEQRGWWRRVDILVYVVGLTALVVYLLHGFDGRLSRDLAIYSYAGQQVAEGVPPYVGILNRAGPLAHLLPGMGVAVARVAGLDDLFGARLLFMVFAVATVCVIYMLARELFASRLAGLVAATAFLSFYGFIEYATNGPREKTPMVLFLAGTLLAIVKRRWFAAGIGMSLAALVWQPAFLVALTAAIVATIALPSSERVPALIRVVIGGLVPAVLCIVYFVLVGAFSEFIDAYLLINAEYSSGDPLLVKFAKKWRNLQHGYGVTLWILMAGLAALAVLTGLAFRRGSPRTPARLAVIAIGASSLVALGWSFRDFNSWPDAFVLLPLAAIGIGGIAKEITDRLPPKAGVALVLAGAVSAVGIALTYSTTQRKDALVRQREVVAALLDQLPQDATIQSIGAPQPLVLSGKRNPTRYQTFLRGLDRYVDDTWPGGLTAFAEWVGRQEPTVISVGRVRVPRWLRETVRAEYRRLPPAPGWNWFVRRSVGRNVRMAPATH